MSSSFWVCRFRVNPTVVGRSLGLGWVIQSRLLTLSFTSKLSLLRTLLPLLGGVKRKIETAEKRSFWYVPYILFVRHMHIRLSRGRKMEDVSFNILELKTASEYKVRTHVLNVSFCFLFYFIIIFSKSVTRTYAHDLDPSIHPSIARSLDWRHHLFTYNLELVVFMTMAVGSSYYFCTYVHTHLAVLHAIAEYGIRTGGIFQTTEEVFLLGSRTRFWGLCLELSGCGLKYLTKLAVNILL